MRAARINFNAVQIMLDDELRDEDEKISLVWNRVPQIAEQVAAMEELQPGVVPVVRQEQPLREVAVVDADQARIDRLVRELLDYARPRSPELELFDGCAVVRETLSATVAENSAW